MIDHEREIIRLVEEAMAPLAVDGSLPRRSPCSAYSTPPSTSGVPSRSDRAPTGSPRSSANSRSPRRTWAFSSWPIVETPGSTWFADGRARPMSYDTITASA